MKKVMCFIDGFNFYHAIDELNRTPTGKRLNKHHLKWLNLRGLASAFIKPSVEELHEVYYFSAFATWLKDSYQRHLAYVKALEAHNVKVVMGNFKEKDRGCKSCGATWIAHEEKESDVNLAIHLLHNAHVANSFDKALVLTADTDLVPVIKLIKAHFPAKEVVAVIPERRFGKALELRNECDNAMRITETHLLRNLLPAKINDAQGGLIVERPTKYNPPKRA